MGTVVVPQKKMTTESAIDELCVSRMKRFALTLGNHVVGVVHFENQALTLGLPAEVIPFVTRPVHQIGCLAYVTRLDVVGGKQVVLIHGCAVAHSQRPVLHWMLGCRPPYAYYGRITVRCSSFQILARGRGRSLLT